MSANPSPQTEPAAEQSVARDFIQLPRRQVVLTMVGLLLAMFLAALDQTIVSTAMPRIIADLGGFDRYTWVTTAYLVASTVAVPIVGRLTDIYGRKIFFIGGISVFIVGSVLAGMSDSMTQLIAFRAIQGLGGGVIMANSFVAIADLFPPEERGKFQGFLGVVFGMASVIGPTLGGFITDNFSWSWIFLINVPVGLPVLLLIAWLFPKITPEVENRKLDYPGMVTLILSVTPVLLALSWGGVQYAWGSPQVVGFLVFGLAMGVAFVVIESKTDSPIMPLEIYRNQMVAVALLATFLTGFGMFGAIIFVPLFFQGVLGASATSSGSFLTPMMLGIVFGATLSGQLLSRTGGHYRLQAVIGTALMVAGAFLISTMNPDTSFVRAVGYIVVLGLGLGATFPTFTLAVQNSVPFRLMGVSTSALQFYRSIGGMLGLAVLGAVMANRFASKLEDLVPETVTAVLPPGQLDAIKDNPQALIDPSAVDSLKAGFAQAGPDGARMVETLLGSLKSALAGAISDVFVLSAVVIGLSLVVSLFLHRSGFTMPEAGDDKVQSQAPERRA
ncbi:MAG: MDR family MFS transporter [Dehalococcoidia bacterium]|nr:MDR family MFS transporter [Dehalococcoidia bacterium]